MILYMETSALVKLVIPEPGSDDIDSLWDGADQLLTSRLSAVESRAALASAHRAGRLSLRQYGVAKTGLARRLRDVQLVEVTEEIARSAAEHSERHALRAYDAVHLASSMIARGPSLVVATYDRELSQAARAEGLAVAGGSPFD